MSRVANTDDVPPGYRMTELGPLPEEWEVVRLGEVVEVKGGKRLPKGQKFSERPTKYPYIRVVNFRNFSITTDNLKYLTEDQHRLLQRYHIKKSDVYISIAGTIGIVGRIPDELDGAHLTENAARIVILSQSLDQNFLIFFLASPMGQMYIRSQTTKTSQPKLALSRIKTLPILLPPIPEQKAIAYILRAVQEAKEKTEEVIKALKELKKSLMKHLFTYGPVPLGEVDKVKLKETEVGDIPEHWEVVRFEDAILKKRIKTSKVKQQNYLPVGRFPIVDQGQNLIAGYWNNEDDVYYGPLPVIVFGDHTRIFKYVDFPFVRGADGTKILIPNTEKYFPLFLYYALLNLKIPSRGYNRHYRILREQVLVLPPLHEQKRIAEILKAVDDKIEAERRRAEALEKVFKALLNDLMTAKRRIPKELVGKLAHNMEGLV